MARPLRLKFSGAVYPLTSRGNARQKIFFNDADRELFVETLAHVISRYAWICPAHAGHGINVMGSALYSCHDLVVEEWIAVETFRRKAKITVNPQQVVDWTFDERARRRKQAITLGFLEQKRFKAMFYRSLIIGEGVGGYRK